MRRHRPWVRAACLVVGLAIASTSLAADGWTRYRNAGYRFAVDLPGTPTITASQTPTPGGAVAPGMIGQVTAAGGGKLFFIASDFSQVATFPDIDKALESGVAGAMSNSKQVLDSESKIVIDGVPGRDIAGHNDAIVSKARVLLKDGRLYMAVGVGLTANGVPAEYPRFMLSLKPD